VVKQAGVDLPFLQQRQNEVPPKRFVGQGMQPLDLLLEVWGWLEYAAQHPTAAGI
jgi:hypothetical protein